MMTKGQIENAIYGTTKWIRNNMEDVEDPESEDYEDRCQAYWELRQENFEEMLYEDFDWLESSDLNALDEYVQEKCGANYYGDDTEEHVVEWLLNNQEEE